MAEPIGWFTVNGVHVPIFDGQSKSDAYKNYINSKHGKTVAKLSSKTTKKNTLQDKENSKTYTDAEVKDALIRYSSNQYSDIRKASNGEKITMSDFNLETKQVTQKDITDRYKNYANAIEQHIANSPKYNGEIYRGIQLKNADGMEYVKGLKIGNELDMKGISSWSSNEKVAKDFSEKNLSKNYSIVFEAKNKSGVSIKEISLSKNEDEILQSAKSRFKIKNVKETTIKDNDAETGVIHQIRVQLEEI